MQKSVEELSKEELHELYNTIESAVKEIFPQAELESLDSYHSFININSEDGKGIATIYTDNNYLVYGEKNNKEKIHKLSSILQHNLGGSWSYFNKIK